MPAARPDDDALAVLIAVRAEFGDDRGVREGAFLDIHNRMTKHLLRRGVSPSVDCQEGRIFGDVLSTSRLKKLYEKGQRLIAKDPTLEAEIDSGVMALRAALRENPGSYLFPLRPRSLEAKQIRTWVVVHFDRIKKRATWHSGRPIALAEADDPNGPFVPVI